MKELLKKAFLFSASYILQPKAGIYILNGHYLSRELNNDPLIFERLMVKLSRFCRLINIQEASQLILNGEVGQVNETLVAFTFDDGFDDCYLSLVPVLDKFNVNACFFINPGFINGNEEYCQHFTERVVLTPSKKPMTWRQIKSLHESGFIIGNHTFDHARLSQISFEEAEVQVLKAKVEIERQLSTACNYFAWPFGQYKDINDSLIDMLLQHHSFIYSGCDYQNYTSYSGRVLNRRHFEANWSGREVQYFLSRQRKSIL